MKILFATSECAPFSKSGGLADVAYSLPPALKTSGDEIAVITPLYQCVRARFQDQLTYVKNFEVKVGWRTFDAGLFRTELNGVTIWFVDYMDFFDRPRLYGYDDDKLRFAFFSKSVIDVLEHLDFMPEIIHCNDWETALTVIYLIDSFAWRNDLRNIRTVYTIHNIAYQGQFGVNELEDTFGLNNGWFDGGLGYYYDGRKDINLMKGAMLKANAVSTVSPTYARELHYPAFGCGLHQVVDIVENKTYGILNGIDMNLYDPSIDKRISSNFSVKDMKGKAKCKAALQEKFGLRQAVTWPLLCSVARLVEQKGIELIMEILPGLMDMGVQLIVYGQGEQKYIDYFNWARQKWPNQIGFSSDYNEETASEVFAGSDFYLMPSRFEPCGLSQMMAMRYGTVPIVHETGGLKDSVRPYKEFDGIGDGFSFGDYQAKDLYLAILEAVKLYFGNEETFALMRKRCMEKDFSWEKSANQYNRMYTDIAPEQQGESISFQEGFKTLKKYFTKLDAKNSKKNGGHFTETYHRAFEFRLTGRCHGTFNMIFTHDTMTIEPFDYVGNDAHIECDYDNLLNMAQGKVSPDKLFSNGQLKIRGNITKGADLKILLAP